MFLAGLAPLLAGETGSISGVVRVSVQQQQYTDLNTNATGTILPNTKLNSLFGTPNSYAAPRRLVLAAVFNF